jgi:hypothetical protein
VKITKRYGALSVAVNSTGEPVSRTPFVVALDKFGA